jgi:hypothetical protein
MTPQELSNMMGKNQFATFLMDCYDCDEPCTINAARISATEIDISGGALFKAPENWHADTPLLAKCNSCFDADPFFHPSPEVYSRCVGYLRPVKNWNKAKQAEFKMRKTTTL